MRSTPVGRRRLALRIMAVSGVLGILAVVTPVEARDLPGSSALEEITADDLLVHLEALQEIADAHGGNRALDTPGYDASADYVVDRVEAAGLQAEVVPFIVEDAPIVLAPPEFERISPSPHLYSEDTDYILPTPNAPTDAEGPLVLISDGCDPAAWEGHPADSIALADISDDCMTAEYLTFAADNVAGILLAPGEGPGAPPAHVHLDRIPVYFGLPTLSVSGDVAEELVTMAATDTVTLRLAPGFGIGEISSSNVITEIPGTGDEVVVVGGHLDSVPDGPGINDNGSGVAGVLAIAERLAAEGISPDRTIRFAWWGAEETPIVGSTAYVNSLDSAELGRIVAYLNVDMIGSPNWVRRITDPAVAAEGDPAPEGSSAITDLLDAWFAERDLPTEPAWWGQLSDTAPFAAAGVPVGGLNTGAHEIKTEREAELYGGTAGEPLDPCYHQPCDTVDNVDAEIAAEMTRALGHVTLQLAFIGEQEGPAGPAEAPAAAATAAAPAFTG